MLKYSELCCYNLPKVERSITGKFLRGRVGLPSDRIKRTRELRMRATIVITRLDRPGGKEYLVRELEITTESHKHLTGQRAARLLAQALPEFKRRKGPLMTALQAIHK